MYHYSKVFFYSQKVELANTEVLARGNVVELLKEQLDCLKKCDMRGTKLRDSERKMFVKPFCE